jgi:Bacterial membrane protein YfhO
MTETAPPPKQRGSWLAAGCVLVTAVGLTYVFWHGLWRGGGLIGNDLYPYYFPQKTFYADRLRAGEFPLWNNLVGHGYPVIGESQTGAYYPFHPVLYSRFDVNTAYNAVQLIHYVLAFVFTWMFARRIGTSRTGAVLAALIYTYGWFPVRIGLEWAILGGAWLPAALWAAESCLSTGRLRYAVALTMALAVQLLAGHYNIAFITLLLLAVYVPGRLWFARTNRPFSRDSESSERSAPLRKASESRLNGVTVFVAVALAFGLAAIQLVPTWELKQHSQRTIVADGYHPTQGHLPAEYLLQTVAPWHYYAGDIDQRLREMTPEGFARTNKVEAHLYFGLASVALILFGLCSGCLLRDRRWLLWGAIALVFTILCTGRLVPVTRHLPGFGYFEGPGRFGIATTFAVALLAAASWDRLADYARGSTRCVLFAVVFGLIAADLWWVGRTVRAGNTFLVEQPPVLSRKQSPVRRILLESKPPPRLFSRGANTPTLLGVASTPTYLGLSPAAYFDPKLTIPQPAPLGREISPEQIDWLQKAGVTHVLSFEPLEDSKWPVTRVWAGTDPLLNRAWARREPLYLYELKGGRGRLSWLKPADDKTTAIREYSANRVVAEVASNSGGALVLTDLAYPGWEVTIDGDLAESQTIDGMYRGVKVPPGKHAVIWSYRPRSQRIGIVISLAALIVGAAGVVFAYRRSRQS